MVVTLACAGWGALGEGQPLAGRRHCEATAGGERCSLRLEPALLGATVPGNAFRGGTVWGHPFWLPST